MSQTSHGIDQRELARQIGAAQGRLQILQEQVDRVPQLKEELVVTELLTELSSALEELEVTTEEIQLQNENLLLAQSSLDLERQRYRELFDFAPDAYLVTDSMGVIQEANQAAALLLQREQQHLIGKPLAIFVAPAARRSFRTYLKQLSQSLPFNQTPGLPVHSWELSLQSHQGSPFPCAITISVIHDRHQQPVGLRWLIRDISERKRVEQELQRVLEQERELNDLRSRLIHTISHEYRSPLNVIKLAVDILKKFGSTLAEERRLQFFGKIDANIKHLTSLVEDVLTYNQAETGKLPFNPVDLNLEQFCREFVEAIQLTIGSNHQLTFTCSGACSHVCMDEKLLTHVLSNLLSNAIKYSPPHSSIAVDLSCADSITTLIIRDRGIGIPAEDQPKLFEPFHRAGNVGMISGTGVGMAIVKRAVDLHGGQLTVTSEVGVGTQVHVRLPTAPSSEVIFNL